MLKEMLLFIKYPYTAGIIAIIWLASAILMAISRDLDALRIVMINTITSVIIAAIGFTGKEG
jgi:hypothetical protein